MVQFWHGYGDTCGPVKRFCVTIQVANHCESQPRTPPANMVDFALCAIDLLDSGSVAVGMPYVANRLAKELMSDAVSSVIGYDGVCRRLASLGLAGSRCLDAACG
jgi:hypothetical protein